MNDGKLKLIKLDLNQRMTYGQYTQAELICKIEELESELIHLSAFYQQEREKHYETCPVRLKELMLAHKRNYDDTKNKLEEMGF